MSWLGRHAVQVLAVYLVFVVVVLLSPSPRIGTDGVSLVAELIGRLGADPHRVRPLVEIAENVALVVPVGFLGSLAWPRWSWRDWTALCFLVSLAVETVQWLLLSDRTASFSDVVANTLGAAIGALLARPFRHR